ncbi:MAG TPA: hypothetical protein EYN07_02385 [Flavobacteriaceae bacterium]|nr:hypothetical protein [Flavobacteriaceae bacterium]HIN98067.1 hypothetical protein [Flavobacteriaceae bacterium]
MATVNFLYRSKKDIAPLTIRLLYRHGDRDYQIGSKTKLLIGKDYWNKKHNSRSKDAEIRNKQVEVKAELQKIENHILTAFNNADTNEISKRWLSRTLELYYNPSDKKKLNQTVSYWISKIISEAQFRDNTKGGVGISKSRVQAYDRLLQLFNEWQGDKEYKVKEMNKNKFEVFKKWLFTTKQYSTSYTFKKISDLKTVCKEARLHGVEASSDLNDIKIKQGKILDDDMDVITLTEEEIEKIENVHLISDSHINARKWLILLCFTGQRGKDLTTKLNRDSFKIHDKKLVIRLVQGKGNKPTTIPVLPKVKAIYNEGLPPKMATQKLNTYFKEIGKLAGINAPTLGRKAEIKDEFNDKKSKKGNTRGVKKLRPKYEYLSTHVGRRTFATLHYGKLPTPIIMKVTNHAKESTFLKYINQSDDSHIEAFSELYSESGEDNSDKLKIINVSATN